MATSTPPAAPAPAPAGSVRDPGDDAPPGTPGTGEAVSSRCGGSGRLADGQPGAECGGSGRVTRGIGGG